MAMEAFRLDHDEGEAIWVFDALDTIKADAKDTGGLFSLVEFQDYDGSCVPLHIKETRDAGFYVIDGHYTFVVGGEVEAALPGGFEAFYRDAGEPISDRGNLPARSAPNFDALVTTAARHRVAITGPPPGMES
jgi:glucose dehydrogenase